MRAPIIPDLFEAFRKELERALRVRPRRKPKNDRNPDTPGEAVPVEPNRPNTLSGGAAAALEFDD